MVEEVEKQGWMSPVDLAWAAGLFEGEGSVRINSPTQRNLGALIVDVANTDEAIVAFFHQGWGGYFRRVNARSERRKDFWRWRLAALEAARFLRDISPYLKSPRLRERIRLGLAFQDQKSKKTRTNRGASYRTQQQAYFQRMKVLNQRGSDGRRKS